MFYNFLQTDFGTLTLIWSKNRLHALNFPSLTPTVLINNCKNKYGKLEKKTFNPSMQSVAEQLRRYMKNPKISKLKFNHKIGNHYTSFQKDVFVAVRKIPLGQTKSYQDLGREIGLLNGGRAVGRALSQNLTPLVIPCHRVIGSNNNIIGYSPEGGKFWQELLLYRESERIFSNKSINKLVKGSIYLAKRDKKLKKIIQFHGPAALSTGKNQTLFQMLVRTIIGQQLSVKAAQSIHYKLSHLLIGRISPKRFIGLNKKQLKQCGLSSNKIETLINIAQLFLEKEFPSKNLLESFSDEEFEDLLIQIKGIGKWTCDIVKLFHLCRFDTFPEGDLGVRNGFSKYYGFDIDSRKAEKIINNWSPFRGIACWYLWRLAEYSASDFNFINKLN